MKTGVDIQDKKKHVTHDLPPATPTQPTDPQPTDPQYTLDDLYVDKTFVPFWL